LDHIKAKVAKIDDDNFMRYFKYDNAESHLDTSETADANDEKKTDNQHTKKDSDTTDKLLDNSDSPRLPPISRKTDDESDEPIIPKLLGMYF